MLGEESNKEEWISKKIAAHEVVIELRKYQKTLYVSIAAIFVTTIAAIFGMKMTQWDEIYRVIPSACMVGVFAVVFVMSIFKVKQKKDYLEEAYDLKEEKKEFLEE